jgi:hypothetical protein
LKGPALPGLFCFALQIGCVSSARLFVGPGSARSFDPVQLVLDLIELRQELNEKVGNDPTVIHPFPGGLGCLARRVKQLL